MEPDLPPFIPERDGNESESLASRDARCDAFKAYLMATYSKDTLADILTSVFGALDGFDWGADCCESIADLLGPELFASPEGEV